jgi:hypothetical protein
LLGAFKDASGIRANGLMIGGVKHIAIRADERSVYGKKVFSLLMPGYWWCLLRKE